MMDDDARSYAHTGYKSKSTRGTGAQSSIDVTTDKFTGLERVESVKENLRFDEIPAFSMFNENMLRTDRSIDLKV